jgi:hypothetical protein
MHYSEGHDNTLAPTNNLQEHSIENRYSYSNRRESVRTFLIPETLDSTPSYPSP